jgi:predicted ATP-grasp superfamily ATP-dependent carboligase
VSRRVPPLMIAGWSARAAAQSALRGGFDVAAIDVFQDADLRSTATPCRRATSLRAVARAAAEFPPGEWLYTGGMENHPSVVAAVTQRHRLLGCDAATLRRVRDPRVLQRVLAGSPTPMPETVWRTTTGGIGPADDADGTWLVKTRRSGGGVRVTRWNPQSPMPRGTYRQRFVKGAAWGASFLAAGNRCLLLGVCIQSVASVDPLRGFLYGGSMGPIELSATARSQLMMLGDGLTSEFGLQGLFGVDLIAKPDGSLHTLEINPRYTASMELLERAEGRSLVQLHVEACREQRLPSDQWNGAGIHGKQIIYVDDRMPRTVSPQLADALLEQASVGGQPSWADIPTANTRLRIGDPLCTLFGAGPTFDALSKSLNEQEKKLRMLLSAGSTGQPRVVSQDNR